MARTGLRIVLGIIGLLAIGVVGGIGYLVWLSQKGPSIDEKSVLVIKLRGPVCEYSRPSLSPFERRQISIWGLRSVLKTAAVDRRIAAVWLWLDYPDIGWGKVEEVSGYIDQFRKSHKPVVAYVNAADERGYSIALACDQIFAPSESFLELNGLAVEVAHLPGLLEKLGIKVQYERFGKYKSVSGERYGRKDLSEPVREMIDSLLDGQYESLVSRMSSRRKIPRERVAEILDRGEFTARHALAEGLIDGDKNEIEVEALLKQKLGVEGKLNEVADSTYLDVTPESVGLTCGDDRIAVVHASGLVVQGKGGFNPIFFEQEQGTDSIVKALTKAADDRRTKAIVLRVDCPGGAGFGPDIICSKLQEIQKQKPVIVSMSDYAASGGYWISMAARKIVAQPSTITGSIGVWSIFPDLSGFNEKLGLTVDSVKRGKHADMLFADRPLDEEERAMFRQTVLDTYNQFVSLAARCRKMPLDRMEEIAQGRSWLGSQAKKNGLVDSIGGIDTAIEIAQKEGGVKGVAELWEPASESWFDRLREELGHSRGRSDDLRSFYESLVESLNRLRTERLYTADPELLAVR